jgi:DNA gyrase subunit A
MIAIQSSERNGRMVGAVLVDEHDEIMLITTGGVLVRTRVAEIRSMGRATQGVTLIAVDDGNTLSGVQRVVESDAAAEAAEPKGDAPAEASAGDRPDGTSGSDGSTGGSPGPMEGRPSGNAE